MIFQKPRIVWSVAWGVAALLSCALWVRSYWRIDGLSATYRADTYMCVSSLGVVELARVTDPLIQHLLPNWDASTSPTALQTRSISLFARSFALTPESVVIPLWFPLILTITLASGPWCHWANRFSLRTLFFAMTLVATVMGLIAGR